MNDWRVFRGGGEPHDDILNLPPPPSWRPFGGATASPPSLGEWEPYDIERARFYQAAEETLDLVNAAIYLRRPLLVTGKPGVGKSTLAHAIAHELKLGPVLHWPITSRSALKEGLYKYDAINRLHDVNLKSPGSEADVGRYVTLGPLGTALLPYERPRVLLIDEIDKSDIDLPNDLLTVFEEGKCEIPELIRIALQQPEVDVTPADSTRRVTVVGGLIRCHAFPIVVLTSNQERDFSPAFLRRCVPVEIHPPSAEHLSQIVEARLGAEISETGIDLLERFLERREQGDLATDHLLNAIYLTFHAARRDGRNRRDLADLLLRYLQSPPMQ